MSTQCTTKQLEFLPFKNSTSAKNNSKPQRTRKVTGQFDVEKVSSDGGMVLFREAGNRFRVIKRLSKCFTDYRNPDLITHSLFSIVGQRVLGICCGYEDVNDHDQFRAGPIAGMFCATSAPLAGKNC
ncbi:MAG: transposase [Candidatus Dadabacteria bacterium]|nr:transposase [Candidatus Dadabacteria bacterium]